MSPSTTPNRKPRNLAARMGRWSAAHWKTATFGWLAFVVVAGGELAGVRGCGGHGSSLGVGGGECKPGHGICTSLTLVAVVRSAT